MPVRVFCYLRFVVASFSSVDSSDWSAQNFYPVNLRFWLTMANVAPAVKAGFGYCYTITFGYKTADADLDIDTLRSYWRLWCRRCSGWTFLGSTSFGWRSCFTLEDRGSAWESHCTARGWWVDLDTRHSLEQHEKTRSSVASLRFHCWVCKPAAGVGLAFVDCYSAFTFRVDMLDFYNFAEADSRWCWLEFSVSGNIAAADWSPFCFLWIVDLAWATA